MTICISTFCVNKREIVCVCVCVCVCHLLPGEPHPLEALLAVLRAVGAGELEEVVPLQVAGLLAPQLSYTARMEERERERNKGEREG